MGRGGGRRCGRAAPPFLHQRPTSSHTQDAPTVLGGGPRWVGGAGLAAAGPPKAPGHHGGGTGGDSKEPGCGVSGRSCSLRLGLSASHVGNHSRKDPVPCSALGRGVHENCPGCWHWGCGAVVVPRSHLSRRDHQEGGAHPESPQQVVPQDPAAQPCTVTWTVATVQL